MNERVVRIKIPIAQFKKPTSSCHYGKGLSREAEEGVEEKQRTFAPSAFVSSADLIDKPKRKQRDQ